MWKTAIDIAQDRLVKEREALEGINAQLDVGEFAESVKTLELEQSELLEQLDKVTTYFEKTRYKVD